MKDFARDLFVETVAEPYRAKVVEKINLPSRDERERILKEAFYSPAYLNAADVFVDLATDSGAGAMSSDQLGALMRGDEAYIRSRSFFAFESAVQEILGFRHVIPTHQGRAAENVVMEAFVRPGQVVLNNTHSDTTKAHVERRGALAIDLVGDSLWNFAESCPYRGEIDLDRLRTALKRYEGLVPMIIITITNNVACSSPVSLTNMREVRRLADQNGIPVFFDACRFAENAYLVKIREKGQSGRSVREIIQEMMSYAHGCWVSTKKDALSNTGGFIAVNDAKLAQRCREIVHIYEGFHTYGGLTGRDLEAIAVGLREAVDDEYLAHRARLVGYLAEMIERGGVPVARPVGGSGVFLDPETLYPHLAFTKFRGIALFADLYREGGVRIGPARVTLRRCSLNGDPEERPLEFARFAVPRRSYGISHMGYVAQITSYVQKIAPSSLGYDVVDRVSEASPLFAKFAPICGN